MATEEVYPEIEYRGKRLFQVGCQECRKGTWEIFTDEEITKAKVIVAVCPNCHHKSRLR